MSEKCTQNPRIGIDQRIIALEKSLRDADVFDDFMQRMDFHGSTWRRWRAKRGEPGVSVWEEIQDAASELLRSAPENGCTQ